MLATDVGAGEGEIMAQEIGEVNSGLDLFLDRLAIDG
jgi:hypothetical protein